MAKYVTVKELIEKLHKFPQNKRVVIEVTGYKMVAKNPRACPWDKSHLSFS